MEKIKKDLDDGSELSAKTIAGAISDINSFFTPHTGQIQVGKALFYDNKKLIVNETGRKNGKTHLVCYCLTRWAITHPNTFSYYVAPFSNQIADLIWKNGRLPYFLPENLFKKYVHSINNTEMRIMFKNGSFIRCIGSDNYDSARGYSATGLVVYDEGKDINPNFHNAFEPNLAITDAPLLVVGTPAYENDNLFTKLAEMAKVIPSGAYFNFPSHMNPHISKDYLIRKEQEFRDRGEYDVFQVEYLAKRVKIGSKSIFPMLNKRHVLPYIEVMEMLKNERKDFDFFISCDPGSAKCFAVTFSAIHRFQKVVYVLDEIYLTKLGENSSRKVINEIYRIVKEINPNFGDWLMTFDYAAQWFYSELTAEFPDFEIPVFPCVKDLKNKENKLSLMKDMLLNGFLYLTDKVINTFSEMDNYKLNENGKLVKENDHAIDTVRYMLNLANYYTLPTERPHPDPIRLRHEKITPQKEYFYDKENGGLYGDIDGNLFD